MEPEVSTNDILKAIQALDEKLTGKIGELDGKIDAVEIGLSGKIDAVEIGLSGKIDAVRDEVVELIQDLSTSTDECFVEMNEKLVGLDAKIERTRVEMPSKGYIDRKFADYDKESSERAERMFVHR